MRTLLICAASLFGFCGMLGVVSAEEPDDSRIVEQVLRTRDAILLHAPDSAARTVFLAFWDFDGTILKGDCSEGLRHGEQTVYPGQVMVPLSPVGRHCCSMLGLAPVTIW